MILADSLVKGFLTSNLTGQGIVLIQILSSVIMFAAALGKYKELHYLEHSTRRFKRDFNTFPNILDLYLNNRPSIAVGIERIYKDTCERLLKLMAPDTRALLVGRATDGNGSAAMTAREIELVRGTSEHALDEEEIRLEKGMAWIATVVALAPMLGLLGTVWGVLDAFAEMGSAGSANLATIAPSISAALVTTVIGLFVAIPGVIAFNVLNSRIRDISSEYEGFCDEVMGRLACEYQGRGM